MIKADDNDVALVLRTELGLSAPKIVMYWTTSDVRFQGARQTDPIVDQYLLRNGVTPLVAVDESKAPKTSAWLALFIIPSLAMLGPADAGGYRNVIKRRQGMFTASELDEFAELPTVQTKPKGSSIPVIVGLALGLWVLND